MEIRGDDSFRIRSYRRAAEAIESLGEPIAGLVGDQKKLLAIPGIGKSIAGHLQQLFKDGKLNPHAELLEKYRPTMLDLLKIQGLGPKTIALIWDAYKVSDLAGVEELARAGKLRTLPRMGEKAEQKILKGIEEYRRISGRFHLDVADETAQKIMQYLEGTAGVDKITPAGSLRRGRETIGDLDLLVTGKAGTSGKERDALIAKITAFPGILEVIAQGENKVSFKLRSGLQVDVRALPPESFGAAMQYFTGSKDHNVAIRTRAVRMGLKLSEYGLYRIEDESRVAGATEAEIYEALGLRWIPPEMRENCGEIEAAEAGELPELVELKDIRGDVHMHTTETDGRATLEEMAEAGRAHGYEYIAITDHSKALAMANGLDEARAVAFAKQVREINRNGLGIRVFSGLECDILRDGTLDLAHDALAELDLVIGSVHSHMNLEPAEMTDRLLRALECPQLRILGHPTGRILLHRDPYPFDFERVVAEAVRRGVWLEINAGPERLDLGSTMIRTAKSKGARFTISTDAHRTQHLDFMRYGVITARRGWL